MMNVETTEEYWDCECATNFIHPKTVAECLRCGAQRDDQPDSRVSEVIAHGLPFLNDKCKPLDDKQKREVIRQWYAEGRIKHLDTASDSYEAPSILFGLGITPRLVAEVCKEVDAIPKTRPRESGFNPKRKKRVCIACDAVVKAGSSMTDQGWQAVEMRITQGKEHFRFYGRACPLHHKELFDALEKFEKKHPSAALRRGHIR